MTTADRLLEQMFSWIDQRSRCADQLVKLARELESLRQNCNGGEAVGSTMAVVGAACVIGAGVTFLTGGAAAPFLGVLGGTYLGAGAVISVTTKLLEHFLSGSTMKDAKEIEEKSNKLAEDIQRLFEELKSEKKKANRSADPDDLDRHILTDILRAVARRSGVKVDFRMMGDLTKWSGGGRHHTGLSPGLGLHNPIVVSITGILAFFTLQSFGKESKFLFAKGAQQLIQRISVTGLKTVLKGGGMLVGGAIGMAFALNDAIDSWTDLIKKNNVTEASQSLRDTATAIRKICQALKDQFEEMKQMLEKMAEEQAERAKVKNIIENPNRSSADEEELIRYAMKTCNIEEVRRWLGENSGSQTFLRLVELFRLMKNKITKSQEEKSNDEDIEVDIIFVAHGSIRDSMIPASCLLPTSNIQDVLLYSPWNCVINARAAYGISTGLMQPDDKGFYCRPKSGCEIPDEKHKPSKLPDVWNSMKGAGQIPNIMVSTLKHPEDKAWNGFVYLTGKYGEPRRGRIVVPFDLGGLKVSIPFYIVTWVMSLVLSFFRIEATVHLAACLGDKSTKQKFPKKDLEDQYSYTIDNTGMTSSQPMSPITHPDLFRSLQATFD
ncbi:uncharacterized protein LOC128459799 [Pleuronectes platessa]|uniref:uncharacterized protein LOC128459799 n=1 Tax=Pleuronectes platessa TaxID=8262 RepID=UPI00232A0E40|nr:uncharacterized protein LOC128459799 [Pleuronectes platessa]